MDCALEVIVEKVFKRRNNTFNSSSMGHSFLFGGVTGDENLNSTDAGDEPRAYLSDTWKVQLINKF